MGELFSALTTRLESSGERVMLTLMGYFAVTFLLVAAFIALVYAGATAISQAYGPVAAAVSVAAVALLAALLVALWLNQRRKMQARRARVRRHLLEPTAMNAATHLLPVMLRASPMGTLFAIAAAAYVVSKASQRRE